MDFKYTKEDINYINSYIKERIDRRFGGKYASEYIQKYLWALNDKYQFTMNFAIDGQTTFDAFMEFLGWSYDSKEDVWNPPSEKENKSEEKSKPEEGHPAAAHKPAHRSHHKKKPTSPLKIK